MEKPELQKLSGWIKKAAYLSTFAERTDGSIPPLALQTNKKMKVVQE